MNPQQEQKIRGIVLDWAGTIVDFGSLAPMGAFVELFARHQVEITIAEARVPMGLPKIDHIAALGCMPTIAAQWEALNGRPFNNADAQQLLTEFEPMSAKAALDRSHFIPGFMTAYHALQAQGLAFATTTGYTRKIMTPLIEIAHAQGFKPALVVCCDDVARSRPDPMGMQACLQAMGWTHEHWLQASEQDQAHARTSASNLLISAGAHEVIDSVADLPDAIARIEQRMASGETP